MEEMNVVILNEEKWNKDIESILCQKWEQEKMRKLENLRKQNDAKYNKWRVTKNVKMSILFKRYRENWRV